MNTQNVLLSIDNDLNVLYHSGVPGMSWYKHKQGKWQSHAQYAMGQANPDAKEKKVVIGRAVDKVRSAKGRFDAKQDAAITATINNGNKTYGARRLGAQRLAAGFAGSLAGSIPGNLGGQFTGGILGGIGGSGIHAVKNVGRVTTEGISKAISRGVDVGARVGGMYGAFKVGSIGYDVGVKTYDNYIKKAYEKRGRGSLENMKVSKAYEKAYKDTYDKYLKEYSKKVKNYRKP